MIIYRPVNHWCISLIDVPILILNKKLIKKIIFQICKIAAKKY